MVPERCVRKLFSFLQLVPSAQTVRVTPAMEAGIADHVWDLAGALSWTPLLWKLRMSRLAVMSNILRLCTGFLGLAVLLIAQNPTRSLHIIGSGDTLRVTVYGQSEPTRTVLVDGEGTVTLPLVGTVTAEGLNVSQFTQRIKDALAPYMANPEVETYVERVGTKLPN